MEKRKIEIIDSTLRDGNHTVANNFSLKDIESIVNHWIGQGLTI